jgi:hypothetical protein
MTPFDPNALCGADRSPAREIATALDELAKDAEQRLRRTLAAGVRRLTSLAEIAPKGQPGAPRD